MSNANLLLSQTGFYLVTKGKVTLSAEESQEVWRECAKRFIPPSLPRKDSRAAPNRGLLVIYSRAVTQAKEDKKTSSSFIWGNSCNSSLLSREAGGNYYLEMDHPLGLKSKKKKKFTLLA